ncbi:MAG: UPF0158 family protein [Chitinophagaceae bacterium]
MKRKYLRRIAQINMLGASYPPISFMDISREILTDIADSLKAGFKCFIHKDTCEVVTYLNPDQNPDMDPKDWKEEISKVRKGKKKFIEIECMESSESFKILEGFVHTLENNSTKIRLLTALEGQKPFANFKHQIDNSGDYRELWFKFRRNKNIEWVLGQLNANFH